MKFDPNKEIRLDLVVEQLEKTPSQLVIYLRQYKDDLPVRFVEPAKDIFTRQTTAGTMWDDEWKKPPTYEAYSDYSDSRWYELQSKSADVIEEFYHGHIGQAVGYFPFLSLHKTDLENHLSGATKKEKETAFLESELVEARKRISELEADNTTLKAELASKGGCDGAGYSAETCRMRREGKTHDEITEILRSKWNLSQSNVSALLDTECKTLGKNSLRQRQYKKKK